MILFHFVAINLNTSKSSGGFISTNNSNSQTGGGVGSTSPQVLSAFTERLSGSIVSTSGNSPNTAASSSFIAKSFSAANSVLVSGVGGLTGVQLGAALGAADGAQFRKELLARKVSDGGSCS